MSAALAAQRSGIVDQIRRAAAGVDLSSADMRDAIEAIMDGHVGQAQTAAFLVALSLKGETAEELAGAATAMRARAIAVRPSSGPLLDVCGTGGDGSGTFNISTAVALVVAGAGVPVAKHGNRAMSSRCGSADVLEALGVRIDLPAARAAEIIDEVGVGFLFAQAHHPAMRHVAPVRREIGIRTLFNLLGPLTNPAGARRQLVGVAHLSSLALIADALGRLGSERAVAVHGCDGLDEATLAGLTHVADWTGERLSMYEITPEDAGLDRREAGELQGGEAGTNARIIRDVLGGQPGARRDVVVFNAALALLVAGMAPALPAGREIAERSIDSGAAVDKLAALIEASNA